jgi:hypothetical protein
MTDPALELLWSNSSHVVQDTKDSQFLAISTHKNVNYDRSLLQVQDMNTIRK